MKWGSLKSDIFCPLSTHCIAMTPLLSNSPVATQSAGGCRSWGYVHAAEQAYLCGAFSVIVHCVKLPVIKARLLIWTFLWYPITGCHKISRKTIISDASFHLPHVLETVGQHDHVSLLSLENQDANNIILKWL